MIGRMEKLFIVGPKKLAPMILLDLQRAGVVRKRRAASAEGGEIGSWAAASAAGPTAGDPPRSTRSTIERGKLKRPAGVS